MTTDNVLLLLWLLSATCEARSQRPYASSCLSPVKQVHGPWLFSQGRQSTSRYILQITLSPLFHCQSALVPFCDEVTASTADLWRLPPNADIIAHFLVLLLIPSCGSLILSCVTWVYAPLLTKDGTEWKEKLISMIACLKWKLNVLLFRRGASIAKGIEKQQKETITISH